MIGNCLAHEVDIGTRLGGAAQISEHGRAANTSVDVIGLDLDCPVIALEGALEVEADAAKL